MMLRFRYGNVNNEYEYQDHQLQSIDSCLDEDQIRRRFADTYSYDFVGYPSLGRLSLIF